jgi:hypothetical protein
MALFGVFQFSRIIGLKCDPGIHDAIEELLFGRLEKKDDIRMW